MVHDPRAPRLAAMSTLSAAILVILTALNLVLNVVGSTGPSAEEGVALAGVGVFLLVARLASVEREIPELNLISTRTDVETFDALTSSTPVVSQREVNPTTATILTSILGEQATTNQQQVNSAIDTLSSGTFGESVRQTMEAVELANQKPTTPREATPADEETGQTLERVVVQSIPLPGQPPASVIDQGTIPGLEPNRKFVTEGIASIPLPGQDQAEPSTPAPPPASPEITPIHAPTSPSTPDLPDLPGMLDLPAFDADEASDKAEKTFDTPSFELPDLDGLFAEEDAPPAPKEIAGLPDLPDLDDLF
ncbi:MAG TPA: hypothetical protein D7H92_02275 [Candidatus Poseidoniales archaeon]|nr:MAG TPA: hypothetical protein D7H92_02275 [Candidatus Poseidoniales archaeon]